MLVDVGDDVDELGIQCICLTEEYSWTDYTRLYQIGEDYTGYHENYNNDELLAQQEK